MAAASLPELLDLAPIGAIIRLFGTDTIQYWSHGAEALYGWTAAEALGQVTHALLRTHFPMSSRQAVDAALRSVGHWSGELVHTSRDGRRIVVASRQVVQMDEQGSPSFTLELNTDITSIKDLETTLRESEERFRLLVDNVQDYAIFMLSPEGIVLTWNDGAQRLMGFTPEEIIGRSFECFYPQSDRADGLPRRLLAQAAAQQRAEIEGWRVRNDGSQFWADVVQTALRDTNGTLRGYATITRDLTERRLAEELRAQASHEEGARAAAQAAEASIRASRDQLAAILAGVTDGITAIDINGRIVFANTEAARLNGFASVEEFIATPPADILARFDVFDEHGAPFPIERLPTRLALQGLPAPETLVRFRIRDTAEHRWSLVSATAIRDESGAVSMAVSIFRDVTASKRAEEMTRFLATVNLELSRSLDFTTIPQTLVKLAVPTLADWCVVDVFDDKGDVQRVAVACTAAVDDPLAAYGSVLPDANRLLASGRPIVVSTITDDDLAHVARDREHLQALRSLRLRSMVGIPLVARDRVIGGITFATAESDSHYGPSEVAIAEDFATRAALALDNARLYSESQQQTETHVQLNAALRDAMAQLEQARAR